MHFRHLTATVFLLTLGLAQTPVPVAAQAPRAPDQVPVQRAPAALAAGVRVGEVQIDGRIEEADWLKASVASGFTQSEPDEGSPATHDTEVRVLFDDKAIYVAARMWDDPDSIRSGLTRRDEGGMTKDWFGVWFDPNHDRRTGYGFLMTAAGVQQDRYLYDDRFMDNTWDAVWESGVSTDSLGWSVEMRIPLSQIRYNASEEFQTWGVNFTRRRVNSNERSDFSPQNRRRNTAFVSALGTLEKVYIPATGHRVEARPYLLSNFRHGPAKEGDPYFDGNAAAARIGSDFRLGLGSAFTLNATVSPDFGQVEADPAVINLTAFESFFQERRPFFVDDAQIFNFGLSGGQNQLFYSRRIGRSPHGTAPSGSTFVDLPEAATILGAGKLTGRTSGGLSLGALAAVTDGETGEAFFPERQERVEFRAEPRTGYGVVAAQQDLNGGASYVRGIFTMLERGLPADGVFDFLPDRALSAGARFDHQWNDRTWHVGGFLALGHVHGSPSAMMAIQRASTHYFQRPDATRSRVDSLATSMTGAEWRLQLDRQNARHWIGGIWLAEVTQGLEINDLGFSGSRERLDGGFSVGYRELQPGRIFRDYSLTLGSSNNFSHEALDHPESWSSWRHAYTAGSFTLGSQFTFLNYKGANISLAWQPDLYSQTATRGGPVMIQPGNRTLGVSANTDRRNDVNFSANFRLVRGARGVGNGVSIDAGMNLRPNPRFLIGLTPSFSSQSDGIQYVTFTGLLPYQPTFGRRYLFGDLKRKTVDLEARIDYTFTTHLSVQVYAQPFLSSGNYVSYKQLATPETFDFLYFKEGNAVGTGGSLVCAGGTICRDAAGTQHVDLDGNGSLDYTFVDRDFNTRSLVGSAVLRWEYRPGSTIFLVWQRQQRDNGALGDFDFGRDLGALWGAPADNRFVVKVSYWLGL